MSDSSNLSPCLDCGAETDMKAVEGRKYEKGTCTACGHTFFRVKLATEAPVAQLAEHAPRKAEVGSSILSGGSKD